MNTYHRMDCQELSTILRFGGGTFEKGMLRLDLLVSSKAFPASLIISRFLLAFQSEVTKLIQRKPNKYKRIIVDLCKQVKQIIKYLNTSMRQLL